MNQPNNIFSRVATSLAVVLLWSALGCEDPTQSSKPTTNPTAAVAPSQPAEAPAVVAAYPIRPPSLLSIDGRDVTFPGAKLAVIGHGTGGFSLRLCSDDPPTAIDPGYAGNSYVLDMRLAIDRLSELPAATWDFKPSDAGDSTSGIYLQGNREQYHPNDVHISFQKEGDELMVLMTGTFLHNDANNPAAPSERVQVSGSLRTGIPAE